MIKIRLGDLTGEGTITKLQGVGNFIKDYPEKIKYTIGLYKASGFEINIGKSFGIYSRVLLNDSKPMNIYEISNFHYILEFEYYRGTELVGTDKYIVNKIIEIPEGVLKKYLKGLGD